MTYSIAVKVFLFTGLFMSSTALRLHGSSLLPVFHCSFDTRKLSFSVLPEGLGQVRFTGPRFLLILGYCAVNVFIYMLAKVKCSLQTTIMALHNLSIAVLNLQKL